jgi:hypothetical protein
MQTGIEFLKEEIDNTIAQHRALVQSMTEHESDADDQRFRDLCTRHIGHMRHHQAMLEEFRASLGARPAKSGSSELAGMVRQVAGTAFAAARSLADAPRSDYTELVGDLSMVRQLEVTFKVFRDGGRQLGIAALAQIGEIAERHHDEYSADAKRLLQQMFVERSHGAVDVVRSFADHRADFR